MNTPSSPPSETCAAELADLLEQLTARIRAGEALDLEGLPREFPEYADELRRLLPAVQLLADLSHSAVAGAVQGGDLPLGELGDYCILREVGRGGMGVVYEAEQVSLGRHVALKVLPYAATLDPKQLQRFRNEAKAAAGLHHEHIVPVYAVGCERGVHYYAMQFIEGRSLADVIRGLRNDAEGRPAIDATAEHRPGQGEQTPPVAALSTERGGPRGREFYRAVAQMMMQAADALEYAHSMGIVHRDVKPGNLLLDGAGRLWVADFGLARFGPDAGLTMTGDLMGTLRYMAPEQALAKHGLVDHRADVYGLGATLYELLTLRPAVDGEDRRELLRKIAFEDPPPPHRLERTVPAELETITLKALAKDPAERYATARELSDDLGRFLRDEPIRARRPTPLQRVRQWARRHKPAVGSAAVSAVVLLMLALSGLAVSNLYITRERDQKDQALREKQIALDQAKADADAAETQRRQAEVNLRLARQAVDDIYDRMAGRVAGLPQGQRLAREFLLKALQFYQEFARQKGTDPEIRLGAGRAYWRVGAILTTLGRRQQAEEALLQGVSLLQGLVAESAEPRYRVHLSDVLQTLGGTREDAARGIQDRQQAVALAARLVADFPGVPLHRDLLARAYIALGASVQTRPGEAEVAYQAALPLLEQLVAEFPGVRTYSNNLANCHCGLGHALLQAGRRPEAETAFREGLALLGRLPAGLDNYRVPAVAAAQLSLAGILAETERAEEARDAYEQAITLYEKYLVDFPYNPSDWFALNRCYRHLGDLLEQAGRGDEVAHLHRRGLDLFAAHVAEMPDEADFHPAALRIASSLGDMLKHRGEQRERLGAYRRTLDIAERLVARFPGQAAYRSLAGYWQGTLGSVLSAAGQAREAEGAYRRAVAHYQAALALEPTRAAALNNWAWLLATCPEVQLRDARRAVDLGTKAVGLIPRRGDLLNTLGFAHYRVGDWDAAIAALEQSRAFYAKRPEAETLESFSAFPLAMAHWQKGDHAEARRWYEQAVRWMENYRQRDEELLRFRAEAAGLLGINDSP